MSEPDPAYAYTLLMSKCGQCRELFKKVYKRGMKTEGYQRKIFKEVLKKNQSTTDTLIRIVDEFTEFLTEQKQILKKGTTAEFVDSDDDTLTIDNPKPQMYFMMPNSSTTRINQTPYCVLHKILIDGKPMAYTGYRSRYNMFKKQIEQIINDPIVRVDIREAYVNAQNELDIKAKTFAELKKNTNIAFELIDVHKECRIGRTKKAYEAILRLKDFINQIIVVDNPGAPAIMP